MEIALVCVGNRFLTQPDLPPPLAPLLRLLQDEGCTLSELLVLDDDGRVLHQALLRYREQGVVLLVCGGLGSHRQAITSRAAAQAFRLNLALHDGALEQVRDFYQRSGQTLPDGYEKQALLPHKVRLLRNPCGPTPGFFLQQGRTSAFFLPDNSQQLAVMLRQEVLPLLRGLISPQQCHCQSSYRLFGSPRERLEQQLERLPWPEGVGWRLDEDFPSQLLRLSAATGDDSLLQQAALLVEQRLADQIVCRGSASLAQICATRLRDAELSLALAESCTGGLLAKLLTDQPGSSAFFERGAVSYANSAKQDWLGISDQLLLQHGAVSAACARAMAEGIRQRARTDLALAVTGIAGPGGGTADKPVGTVFIALAETSGTQVAQHQFAGDRRQVRLQSACHALDWLRRAAEQRLAGS